jgi:flagellar biosynthesis/type III secretory pathway ATPase
MERYEEFINFLRQGQHERMELEETIRRMGELVGDFKD